MQKSCEWSQKNVLKCGLGKLVTAQEKLSMAQGKLSLDSEKISSLDQRQTLGRYSVQTAIVSASLKEEILPY